MGKLNKYIKNGVIFIDKKSVFIDEEVRIESGCIIYPYVQLRGNTQIDTGTVIDSYTIIDDSSIGKNNKIGPNVHIHTNSIIGDNNTIGNFVEIKESKIGNNNKIKHLSYCGNIEMNDNNNVGCGVVFSNYNFKTDVKQVTKIDNNVMIGSNSVLVAPLEIGSNSVIGAGSVIDKNVPEDSLAIARNKQVNKENYYKPKKV